MSQQDSSLLPIGSEASSAASLPPRLRPVARQLYRQAWDAYREAGCPYGTTDEAMFVWYSLRDAPEASAPVTGKN